MTWGKKKRLDTVREDQRRHPRVGDTWTESGALNRIPGSKEGKLSRRGEYPEWGYRNIQGYKCLWNRLWVWPEGRQNHMGGKKKWDRRVGLEPTVKSLESPLSSGDFNLQGNLRTYGQKKRRAKDKSMRNTLWSDKDGKWVQTEKLELRKTRRKKCGGRQGKSVLRGKRLGVSDAAKREKQ